MKKILILANNDVGLYNFRKELLQKLIDDGNKIYISLPRGERVYDLIKLGCNFVETDVDRRGVNPFSDLKLLIKYIKILKKIKPDLVISYSIKPNIYGGIASRFLDIPYVTNITGLGTAFQKDGILNRAVTFLYKKALKKVKAVFFENLENKQVFVNKNIISEEKCVVMNGAGVNIEEFSFVPLNNDKIIRFLFIGRIMKEKGVEELFMAARIIKKEFINVEFDIVGAFEENYKSYVEELEKEGIINFYGCQKDVKPFIKKAHCIILPSYHEGMSNTLLECAAMGRPLITSDIYGCREAVDNENNGFLCNVKDTISLVNKIFDFINLPFEKKVEMGKGSRKHIEEIFDRKIIIKKTVEKFYTYIMG